ncbi:MAG TPA: cation:proton antiporter [Candidatus Mcinerneyibacteriales bacterium]|nr:cation:proton antiporter [Candidatus Mcinerneyibacteriales bacterium]
MNTLLLLGIVLGVAVLGEGLARITRLPRVTGYVILGVFFGQSLIGVFDTTFITHTAIVNELALAAMAFAIGSELKAELFKKLGRSIAFIVVGEAILAFIFVSLGMYLMNPDKLYQALVLGAVASATAPAATVAVLSQYKARGPLTSTILAVVGIDDAISLVIFAFATTIAKTILSGTQLSLGELALKPLIEVFGAVAVGIAVGWLFKLFFGKVRHPDELLIRLGASLFIILGITTQLGFSELLAIMAYGAYMANTDPMMSNRSLNIVNTLAPLFFAMFFILAGARLNVSLLPAVGLMGLVYTLLRMGGKFAGGTLGALLGKAPVVVKKYVAMGLIPQVGVAVALAILVDRTFGTGTYGEAGVNLATVVINILLFTTIITEVVGPVLTRFAITQAGERHDTET